MLRSTDLADVAREEDGDEAQVDRRRENLAVEEVDKRSDEDELTLATTIRWRAQGVEGRVDRTGFHLGCVRQPEAGTSRTLELASV